MKNCPRCGSGDKYVRIFGHYENGEKTGMFVGCWKCGFKTSVGLNKAEVLKAWENAKWQK